MLSYRSSILGRRNGRSVAPCVLCGHLWGCACGGFLGGARALCASRRRVGPRLGAALRYAVDAQYIFMTTLSCLSYFLISCHSGWTTLPATRTPTRTGHGTGAPLRVPRATRTLTFAPDRDRPGAATVGRRVLDALRLLSMQHVSRTCPRPRPAPTQQFGGSQAHTSTQRRWDADLRLRYGANGERPIPCAVVISN